MVSRGYEVGFRAIKKQILPAVQKSGIGDVSKFTFDLLNRTAPGWMKQ